MSKEVIAFAVPDISALAKSIKKDLDQNQNPSHVEILNILARGAGYKNFQHFRAGQVLEIENQPQNKPQEIELSKTALNKVAKYFDNNLMLKKWPNKESLRELVLWVIWSRIPIDVKFNEISFSRLIDALHTFGDAALIRRYLHGFGFITRAKDGTDYRRVEREIPIDIIALVNISKSDIPIKKKREYVADIS